MSLLRSAARRLGLGKYKHYRGVDLQGNEFFEHPHPTYPDEWRKNKRYVEYAVARPLSDYNYETIPVQWTSWLRRTRQDPPTLRELQVDLARQVRLQENVRQLEVAYKEEKLRLAAMEEEARMITSGGPAEEGNESGLAKEQEEALPKKDGGVQTDEHAAEVARELGTGEQKPKTEEKVESPEELAKKRREEERAEALRRREEFARQNPAAPRGNPSDSFQPEGWSPAPARRRRA
ncbi:hypothetical protein JCM8097_002403 [Rhodosporidiobolus ruineniae]